MKMNELQAAIFAARGMGASDASHLMSLSPSAVHIDRALTNCAISYRNREYIADQCMPVVTVAQRSDKIFEFPVETMQQLADVSIAGNRGMPGEVKYGLNSSKNYSVSDYALMDFVSNDEIANADAPLQPKVEAVEIVTNFLMLARESRVASAVFGAGNYGANTAALAGASRWDTSTSDPVQAIEDAIESCFVRPTHLVLGGQVWPKLRNHPKFLQYILSRASTASGDVPLRVSEQLIADAFGLDQVIERDLNTARTLTAEDVRLDCDGDAVLVRATSFDSRTGEIIEPTGAIRLTTANLEGLGGKELMHALNPERFNGIEIDRAAGGQAVEEGHIFAHVADAAATGAAAFSG